MIRQHDVVLARTDLAHAGLDGDHLAKLRPCVVVAAHADHLHVIPLTAQERPLRLSKRLPGSRVVSKLIPVVLEVRRSDLHGTDRLSMLCGADALRVEGWFRDDRITIAPPRWCQPALATSEAPDPEVLIDLSDATMRAVMDVPPVTLPADEAMALLTARRLARCVPSAVEADGTAA